MRRTTNSADCEKLVNRSTRAFFVRNRPELIARLLELLELAVKVGCPRSSLDTYGHLAKFKEDHWYQKLLERCDPDARGVAPFAFIRPPTDASIKSVLR